MRVHQFLTSFAYGDAIGNEAAEIRDFLRRQGIESEIFCLFHHPRYAAQVHNYLEYDRFAAPDDVVIFHFSIGSPVTKKFLRLAARKVIVYHNITPHHFFLDYHRTLAKDCYKGRIELKSFVPHVDLALGDSEYNRKELEEAGFPRTGVLPLVMDFDRFDLPVVPVLRRLYDDGKTNILTVGRIIPNKCVEDVLKAFSVYQRQYNPDSRLFLVGEHRGFERYLAALQDLVTRLGVRHVHFTGHVPQAEAISYWKLAHLYLHLSEHEGFCAPIPEAYRAGLPVVAFAAAAVPETMAGAGLQVHRKDFSAIAALIDTVLSTPALKGQVVAGQRQALATYTRERTGAILLDYLRSLAA